MSQLTSSTASRDALSPLTGSPRRSPTAALRARTSISTQASELDLLPLPKLEDARAADDRVLASRRIGSPGMSVLARPRRAVLHLRAAPAFLVDAAAFVRRSPGTLPAEGEPAPPPPRRAVAQPPPAAPAPAVARAVPTVDSIARGMNSSKTLSPLRPPAPNAEPMSILIGVDPVPDAREERTTKRKGVRALFGLSRRAQ